MKSGALLCFCSIILTQMAAADVRETEEFSYKIEPGARLGIENTNGDIKITGGESDTVHIIAHKKAGKQEYLDGLEIRIEAESDSVRIETRHPKSSGRWFGMAGDSSGSVSYELSVPSDVELDGASTVNGDIEISGISGPVRAETVNGGLAISGLASDARLETVNGSVKADFITLSGDQRVSAESVNGRIVLRLPADASARVNAETVNGSIEADDFGLEAEKGFVGRDLEGQVGAGEARLSLDTVNGSIRLEKK